MIAIPFVSSDWPSCEEVRGLLRLEDDALVLEFRASRWGNFNRAKVREARVPRGLITGATLKERWFGDTLTIQSATLRAWEDFPNALDGRARLRIARDDREAGRELVALLAPGKVAEPVDELA